MNDSIQEAHPDDAEEILSVINTSNREAYRNLIPKEYFKEPVLSLEKLLEAFGRMRLYVYRSQGRIVGVAALQTESEGLGRIRWVYVLPGHQRRGIGTALVTRIEQEARKAGIRRLGLLTVEKAYWAVGLYEKLGYGLAERIERPWGFDVFMTKEMDLPHRSIPAGSVGPADCQPGDEQESRCGNVGGVRQQLASGGGLTCDQSGMERGQAQTGRLGSPSLPCGRASGSWRRRVIRRAVRR